MTRIFALVCAAALALDAQHAHAPAGKNEKPVRLWGNLGPYSHPIATAKPEAQAYFDQGLLLLYGFNRYEAMRSFRKAVELDPAAPMPLWGVAMAQSPFINMDMEGDVNMKEACAGLERARALQPSPYERAFVETAAVRCDEKADYIAAARRLMERYPDDPEAATFYAESLMIPVRWNWFQPDGTPNGQMDEAVRVLEQVMRRHPEHPGANHLYIHAVEMSASPERAIPSAQRLMGIAPGAGHLVHMPGHIWLLLGEWEMAADVNQRAVAVDLEYFAKSGVESGYLGYMLHNQHFVVYSRMMQGREEEALREAEALARYARPAVESMPPMADAFLPYPIFARVRFGRWDDVLAMARPDGRLHGTLAVWHWARALAHLAQGRRAAAQTEAAAFERARAAAPADWPWLINKANAALEMVSASLQARLAEDAAAAIAHWRRAVALQDALQYDEPPPWYMPLRESLGAAVLRAGDAAGAEAIFREGLRRSPRNGRLLFGLAEALTAQGKTEGARQVRREHEREWRKAARPLALGDL